MTSFFSKIKRLFIHDSTHEADATLAKSRKMREEAQRILESAAREFNGDGRWFLVITEDEKDCFLKECNDHPPD